MPKLLLVEDELEVMDTLKDYFTHHGVEVLTADSGEEGLKLLAAQGPDVVLLDMKLGPGSAGWSSCAARRGRNLRRRSSS